MIIKCKQPTVLAILDDDGEEGGIIELGEGSTIEIIPNVNIDINGRVATKGHIPNVDGR